MEDLRLHTALEILFPLVISGISSPTTLTFIGQTRAVAEVIGAVAIVDIQTQPGSRKRRKRAEKVSRTVGGTKGTEARIGFETF